MDYKKLEKEINNKNSFYVRIRSKKDQDGFVYYNGFKMFKILDSGVIEYENDIKKFLKFNSYNIKIDNIKNDINENRKAFYDDFSLCEMIIEKGSLADTYSDKYNNVINTLKKYSTSSSDSKIFKFINLSIDDEYEIYKAIYTDNIVTNGEASFNYNVVKIINTKFNMSNKKEITIDNIDEIAEKMSSSYEKSKIDKEKKYQHLFLKNIKNNKELFGDKSCICSFEEEYYIDEINNDGRIDCIFYNKDKNNIKDIYLIELKVDTTVFAGKNGIHKHLLYIKNIPNFDKKNNTNFYDNLLDRINYRNKVLDPSSEVLKYDERYEKHFYIVLGQSDVKKTSGIISSFKTLNTKKNNEMARPVTLKNIPGIEEYSKFNKKTIKELFDTFDKKSIDIKLFIDNNHWDKTTTDFNPQYIDYSKYLYEEKNDE